MKSLGFIHPYMARALQRTGATISPLDRAGQLRLKDFESPAQVIAARLRIAEAKGRVLAPGASPDEEGQAMCELLDLYRNSNGMAVVKLKEDIDQDPAYV